jgi:hypothetical protein
MGKINMKKQIKCRVVFVVGGKGGVGKSWVISMTAQNLEANGIRYALIDGDDETSTTTRFFPTAIFLSIRSSVEIDRIVQMACDGAHDVILVDLPARAGDEFGDWFQVVPYQELEELGIRFTGIGVICGNKDSIECILRWLEFLGNHVDPVLALNRRDNLSIYENSRARQQFLAAGYPEIEIPKLEDRLVTELDKANWTINHALAATEPHFLTQLMSRARLRRYRDQVFAELNKIKTLIVP